MIKKKREKKRSPLTQKTKQIVLCHFLSSANLNTRVDLRKAMSASSLFSILVVASAFSAADAFVSSHNGRHSITLNLEDHIADMIDGELHRLRHKHEADQQWLHKQRQWSKMEPTLPPGFDFEDGIFGSDLFSEDSAPLDIQGSPVKGFRTGVNREISMVQRRRDEKMANDDPMRYCADRCVTTGNCDVFEDMFDLDPREVIKFCKECVLSEDEEPCDVPEKFLEDDLGLHP